MVDASRFRDPPYQGPYPRTLAYLRQLPEGLESFPECRAKGSIHRKVYEYSQRPLKGLPEELQELLDRPPTSTSSINQCKTLALIVAMVEARQLEGLDEVLWIREAATHLFASPMYKVLMWAATPRMVFKSANLRWSAFFKGSRLSSEVEAHEGIIRLHAPKYLFNRDLARIFVSVIYAAVNYTREDSGKASLELQSMREDVLIYTGAW